MHKAWACNGIVLTYLVVPLEWIAVEFSCISGLACNVRFNFFTLIILTVLMCKKKVTIIDRLTQNLSITN